MFFWAVGLLAMSGGLYAAYRYAVVTELEVPTQRVRKGDFIISVRTRGDIKSSKVTPINAPQAPGLRIQRMARNGSLVQKGDVLVEFDPETQKTNVLNLEDRVASAEGQITQTKASYRSQEEQEISNRLSAEFNLEKAKLAASKATVISDIEGKKANISVGVQEGNLETIKTRNNASAEQRRVNIARIVYSKDKTIRDLEKARSYVGVMTIKSPVDGVVNILTNFRSSGNFGRSGAPPFKEGDSVWTGATIMEIPDLSEMYIDLKLDEVDRGKIAMNQMVKIRVDSIPDKEFTAKIDFISPAAAVVFTGVGRDAQASSEKNFPARATLTNLDPRLRPGTSASAEIIVERQTESLVIPLSANFDRNGKPIVYVQQGKDFVPRQIQIGKRNETDVVVTAGLREGEVVATEDPVKLARAAKKKKL
jgi:RND family efflux transporter MFP subunit